MSNLEHNMSSAYPCPCCGYLTQAEPPGSDEICPICGWQDDITQLRFPKTAGGENEVSLLEAQANFLRIGASQKRLIALVKPPTAQDQRDPDWRPIDERLDRIEEAINLIDYGSTYPSDRTHRYYWRTSE